MERNILLNSNIEITQIELKNPIYSLWVQAEMEQKQNVLIFLFNPCNHFCGSISFGLSNFLKEIYISDTICTMNGLHHQLLEGTYSLVFLSIKEESENKPIAIKIQIEANLTKDYPQIYCQDSSEQRIFDEVLEPTHRYYKGDFHGHTIFSDGHQTIEEAKNVLMKQGLDFMAFTEHNNMPHGLPKLPSMSIPSFELTLPIGHMNIHGVKDMGILFEQCSKIHDYESLWECVIQCFRKDCNLSINHLFMNPWHLNYEDFDLSKINTIEVICDPTYPSANKANKQAVEFLDYLWQEGLHIYGIGGSDSHNKVDEFYEGASKPSIYGDPSTYVYCKGLSVFNVIEGVRKGHCYVTRYNKLDINICDGNYLPGDIILEAKRKITYQIFIESMELPCIGRFILNGKTVKEILVNEKFLEVSYQWDAFEDPWWFRFGLYDEDGQVIAYVNPIYHGTINCQTTQFKKLLAKYGEEQNEGYTI